MSVPIITALNVHKDEINTIGAERFAGENDQEVIDLYSDNSITSRNCWTNSQTTKKVSKKIVKLDNISDELQEHLWDQLLSKNSMKIASKLVCLCLGMPVMI